MGLNPYFPLVAVMFGQMKYPELAKRVQKTMKKLKLGNWSW